MSNEIVVRKEIAENFGKSAKLYLIGDKEGRKIKYETYQKIISLPKSFTGFVEIRELGIATPLNQIARLEINDEKVVSRYKTVNEVFEGKDYANPSKNEVESFGEAIRNSDWYRRSKAS